MNQRIKYSRVSTDDQILDKQRNALKQSGCGVIFEEVFNYKTTNRPKLKQCLDGLKAHDTLVVWRLDKLAHSLSDLIKTVTKLERNNIGFESLTEKLETTSAAGKLVFHVFTALSKFEQNLIRGSARTGSVANRARGRAGGRKPKLDDKQIQEIEVLLRDPNIRVAEVARRYGVSRTTLYKHVGVVSPHI